MKIIAITQRVEIVQVYNEVRDCLDQKWSEFLLDCGFTPLILPNNLQAVKQIISKTEISGIVLTGGNNLVKYGGNSRERDDVERYLIDYSIKKDLPLLGVCRGMQVIQDYFGVSLEKIKGHIAVKHTLTINNKEVLKNSFHSLGAKDSANELIVTAKSEDGVIEGIKHIDKKIHGIMWHPERNTPFDNADIKFMKEIFEN